MSEQPTRGFTGGTGTAFGRRLRRVVARNADPQDPFAGLTGEDRDAAVALNSLLSQWGLESLAPKVLEFIQNGYDANTVGILLQETPEYKQRFAANEARRRKGLPVLSPAEYLATERSYREIMSSAGLPLGFYDEPADFQKWLEDDVSPNEINQRVQSAVELVNNVDPGVREQFKQWYTDGDMIAYALDRQRATDILQRQVRAAAIGDAASDQGVGVDRSLAERVAATGINDQAARQGFNIVATEGERGSFLGSLSGEEYGTDDAVAEVFFDDAEATQKRRRLASQERARFSGSGGQSRSSLSRNDSGQV